MVEARPVQVERQRMLVNMGTAEDGAMLVRNADPPRGLDRATADRPILEIIAITYAATRSQEEAEAAVLRFGAVEPPVAFMLACREIDRLDLCITELERRAIRADGRPDRAVLQGLVRAYVEMGRHMDAMLMPRVLGRSRRLGAGAVYALLADDEEEFFLGEHPLLAYSSGLTVDEAAGLRQAIEALLAVSVATLEEEGETEQLIARLGGDDAADVTHAVERLRSLGARVARVVERHCREGSAGTQVVLRPLLEEWAWVAAEAAFAGRAGLLPLS